MLDAQTEPMTRQDWMGLLARAPKDCLATLWSQWGAAPEFTWLRKPETGGVMVRGRAGGTGAAFNLGEMTVTRCALRLETGEVGHAYVQGRSASHAQRAALIDALMQGPSATDVTAQILTPLRDEEQARRHSRAAKAASTKVDFFTMVRGED